eukprot:CAMPEP_0119070390 /NCGR_PEP_ID=MMETSP1178-20130426/37972_1 /TAXON_ID=33656 /ORGANISM="unid sp, Strain CCMP2000" /LENGTH=407 /DNA_ID=CAMNT_0007052221 /DNA_START=51 /DNA_END=1274 /DNA_ORIENTATION=+
MRSQPSLTDEEPPVHGSASCAPATLDEPSDRSEQEVEDVPRADEEEEEEEEEPPFTEEEVSQMHDEIRELAKQMYTDQGELDSFLGELDSELQENGDLQERGHILLDVLEYLQNPEEQGEVDDPLDDEGEEDSAAPQQSVSAGAGGEADGDDDIEPYPGEEGLQELWREVQEVCSEEDIKRLEEELDGKPPEEQWKILMEVYEYLAEEQEQERQEFEAWKPSKKELETDWQELMGRVPTEDVDEVQADWKTATAEEKKQMVWDVRKLLDEEDDEEPQPKPKSVDAPKPPKGAPPPPRGGYTEDAGKSEVRRRGGGSRRPEPEDLEYDFERAPDGGDWDEYYNKEARRSSGRGRPYMLISCSLLLLLVLTLLLTAALLAEEDQSVMQSAMGLIGFSHAQPTPVYDDAE